MYRVHDDAREGSLPVNQPELPGFSARALLQPLAKAEAAIAQLETSLQVSSYSYIWENQQVYQIASTLCALTQPRVDPDTLALLDVGVPLSIGLQPEARSALGVVQLTRRLSEAKATRKDVGGVDVSGFDGTQGPDQGDSADTRMQSSLNRVRGVPRSADQNPHRDHRLKERSLGLGPHLIYSALPVETPPTHAQIRKLTQTLADAQRQPNDLPILLRALLGVRLALLTPTDVDDSNLVRLAIPMLVAHKRNRSVRQKTAGSGTDNVGQSQTRTLWPIAAIALRPYPPPPDGQGALTHWLKRALTDVAEAARASLQTSQAIHATAQRLEHAGIYEGMKAILLQQPAVTGTLIADVLGVTVQAANARLRQLEATGVLVEITGRARFKIYRLAATFDVEPVGSGVRLGIQSNGRNTQNSSSVAVELDAALAEIERLIEEV